MKKKTVEKGKKLVFSFNDGTILEYLEEDAKTFNDGYHIILDEYPYGCKRHPDERLHIGKDTKNNCFIPCNKCIAKFANEEMIEQVSEMMFEKIKKQIEENSKIKDKKETL
jgi:hypothetical protein